MSYENDNLGQIVSELGLFACYRCKHNYNGDPYPRVKAVQENMCRRCFLHQINDRLEKIGFDPSKGFDESLVTLHFKS